VSHPEPAPDRCLAQAHRINQTGMVVDKLGERFLASLSSTKRRSKLKIIEVCYCYHLLPFICPLDAQPSENLENFLRSI
jgi:hypothetical protein